MNLSTILFIGYSFVFKLYLYLIIYIIPMLKSVLKDHKKT